MPEKKVFGKRMFIFSNEYANDNVGGKRGMLISIGSNNTFVPCGEPVDLTFDVWSLLKNIGRIGRVVTVEKTEDEKKIL